MRATKMIKRPEDFAAREQALDPNQSFICEAPAGSGKTELLTQRLLVLLSRAKKPEEVLAITFTRKAAGEMRDRLLSALKNALTQPCPEQDHQKHTWDLARKVLDANDRYQWELLDNPNRLQIRTFDSLCAQLIAFLPLQSTFGSAPKIVEDSDELYEKAVQNFMTTLEDEVSWSDALAKLLMQVDNQFYRLESLLIDMLKRRDSWLPLFGSLAKVSSRDDQIKLILEQHLNNVRVELVAKLNQTIPNGCHREIVSLAAYAAHNLRDMNLTAPTSKKSSPIIHCLNLDLDNSLLPNSDEQGMDAWLGIITLLTTDKGDWRKSITKTIGFPSEGSKEEKQIVNEKKAALKNVIDILSEHQEIKSLFKDVRNLPSPAYNSAQWEQLEAIGQVLPVLAAHLTLVFQEKNCVDFTEVAIKARTALGQLDSPSDLAIRLDYRIQHILVDEFQDTSIGQVQLLELLTAGWQPDDGRTLFCVGDAMQSIYGFRGANVGLFLHSRENGLGSIPLTSLQLTTNFRSYANIVNWNNRCFADSFPDQNDISSGAVSYSVAQAFNETEYAAPVFHAFILEDDETRENDEAATVLKIVQERLNEYPDDTIAILVRSRSHAVHIAPVLRQANINYRAVDLEPLSEVMAIQDLMALTLALLYPADRTAWLSILRAPWCGLSLNDLDVIANAGDDNRRYGIFVDQLKTCLDIKSKPSKHSNKSIQSDMFTEDAFLNTKTSTLTLDGLDRLQRVFPILVQALKMKQRKSLRQWVEGTWIQLGGPACLQQESDLTNVNVYFELLDKLDESGSLPKYESLQKAVNKLFAAPDPSSNEQIQIMTIHKSKGLEFDMVILPSLHRGGKSNDPELLMWQERISRSGHPELLMGPIPPSHIENKQDAIYTHLREEQKKREAFEACRLVYVACTRAKKQLHLLGSIKQDKKDSQRFSPPSKSSLLSSIWNAIELSVKRYDSETHNQQQIENQISQRESTKEKAKLLTRLPKNWTLPKLEEGNQLTDYILNYSGLDVSAPSTEDDFNSMESQNIPDLKLEDKTARNIGTLVHQIIQEMGEKGLEIWKQKSIQEYIPFWRARLINLETPAQQLNESLDRVNHLLTLLLADKNFYWMHGEDHKNKYCEFPISYKDGENIHHLVIDLLIETNNDETWIIDYKTSEPEKSESLNDFLIREKQTYLPVLNRYQSAIKNMGYQNIKLALYFPLLQKLEQI